VRDPGIAVVPKGLKFKADTSEGVSEGVMALSDLTASAVAEAIEEFDRLGRDSFLKKYGFERARKYVLQKDGHSYDSKAIAGAAHGYLPGHIALKPNEFSGGEATVQRTLQGLGFVVVDDDTDTLPSPGDVLTNAEIGRRFVVGNMGGMRRSTKRNLLVLISADFTSSAWGMLPK
jgi:hypothetical protein